MSPSPSDDPVRSFLSGLAAAPARLLVLDYDGTLAPFVEDRLRAVPYEGVAERLAAIVEGGTRVVVVSGRPLAELAPLMPLDPLPELWGSHGWERRLPGRPARVEPLDPRAARMLADAAEAAASVVPNERVERKPASVAVHVRGLPARGARRTLQRIRDAWHDLEETAFLEVEPFDGGIEARVRGHDKGTAVRRIVAEEPPDAHVAYLGDDRTDEDAFRALRGRALTLLVRAEPRPTAADARLIPPEELLAFLDEWIGAAAASEATSAGTWLAPSDARTMTDEPERPETP